MIARHALLLVAGYGLAFTAACGANSSGRTDAPAGGGGSAGGTQAACVADGVVEAPLTPAHGTLEGDALSGDVCEGGVVAYGEDHVDPSTGLTQPVLHLTGLAPAATRFDLDAPADAEGGLLTATIGLGAAAPGIFPSPSDGVCGAIIICVDLASIQSTGDVCYEAIGTSNCEGSTHPGRGSWSLSVTSIVPSDVDGFGGVPRYITHGTLSAVLVNNLDNDVPVTLTLEF